MLTFASRLILSWVNEDKTTEACLQIKPAFESLNRSVTLVHFAGSSWRPFPFCFTWPDRFLHPLTYSSPSHYWTLSRIVVLLVKTDSWFVILSIYYRTPNSEMIIGQVMIKNIYKIIIIRTAGQMPGHWEFSRWPVRVCTICVFVLFKKPYFMNVCHVKHKLRVFYCSRTWQNRILHKTMVQSVLKVNKWLNTVEQMLLSLGCHFNIMNRFQTLLGIPKLLEIIHSWVNDKQGI